MQQLVICGIFIIDLILCLEFFDCFLVKFSRVHKWQIYLYGICLGVFETYMFGFADIVIEEIVFYILAHALAGIIFIDAFRVVWLYFVWFAMVRIVIELGVGGIGGMILTEGDARSNAVLMGIKPWISISLQGLFVYYVHFYKKNYMDKGMKIHWNTLILPVASFGLLFGFLRWQSVRGVLDYSICYFLLFIIITVNLLYYFLVAKVEISYEMALKKKEYEQKNQDYQEHYYKQLEKQQQEIRAIRHDMKNQLIGILGEIDDGDIVRARSEMERILMQIDRTTQLFFTANPGMNAVLGFKSKEMERKYINFTCNVDIPEQLRMEARDIGLLAGNMLDNAIEACEKCIGEKYVHFDAVYRNHTVVIVCENSTDGKVEGFQTRKDDAISHGIGIRSMKELVRHYGGEIDFGIYEKSFRVTVTLFQV